MSKKIPAQERMEMIKEKLESSYLDLLQQVSQIDYGEASLTCVIRGNEIAFAGVSRTRNTMFQLSKNDK
ncbi:MAG: hypothetical protein GXY10_05310 [Clostridiales bacterium]|nr:hypothetical protein [Clostridiales bacterium]